MRRVLLALILLLVASPGFANTPRVAPGTLCAFASELPLDPARILSQPVRADCNTDPRRVAGAFIYGHITGLDLVTDPHDPWELRHEYSQAKAETVYVRYADGRVERAPSDRMSARRMFSPGMVAYTLPARDGTIVAALIVVEGLQNQRGVAPGMEFRTERGALDADLTVLLLYGLLGGAVLALFTYNAALYVSLGYPFILRYCLSAAAMLFMGLCWSGGIFMILPDLDTTTQISLTMFATSLVIATSLTFMTSFIERAMLPRRIVRAATAIAMAGIASCVLRLLDPTIAWVWVDRVTYWSMLGTLIAMVAAAMIAARRGSTAARVYSLAWSVPIVLAVVRVLWGIGMLGGGGVLLAMSPLIIMALEALMAALAVTWRISLLRGERDAARAEHAELRHAANTDALTGLLNRRAFIEGAIQPETGELRHRLILLDIDRFKAVNDHYGHQAGDDVLIAVARVLRDTAPTTALVGRLGGEEFAVLSPALRIDALADRLRRAVAGMTLPNGVTVTISAGVADGPLASDADWRMLYHSADQALYRAKNGGRNRVRRAPKPIAA